MNKDTKLRIIYYFLVFVTFFTLLPIILYLLKIEIAWTIYAFVYFLSIVLYTWYRFIMLAYGEFKNKKYGYYYAPFTVIIPAYNEDPDLLVQCVNSVENAYGNKKVIIIDDGSKNNIWDKIIELRDKYANIQAIKFEQNQGKRKALHTAFNIIDTEFLITIDSDTIIDRYAFISLLGPFKDTKVGATTGNIRLINEKKNLLTRVTAGLYLSGLENYKKAQSVTGNVICCSGCLSAYRTSLVKSKADLFLYQMFLGKRAAHSEDRHLTNLILEEGYKVIYVKESMCYTESPPTLKQFLKQQQRWKRGFVRESIYLLSFSYKRPSLFIEATIGSVIPFFLSFGIQLFILFILFTEPTYVLFYMIPGWVIFMTIREIPMFLEDPKRSFWFYFYIPLYEFLLFWQNIYAIFTVNNKKWLTRNI